MPPSAQVTALLRVATGTISSKGTPMALQFPEKKRLRLAPLGLVLAAGLTLSACGGGDDASSCLLYTSDAADE